MKSQQLKNPQKKGLLTFHHILLLLIRTKWESMLKIKLINYNKTADIGSFGIHVVRQRQVGS